MNIDIKPLWELVTKKNLFNLELCGNDVDNLKGIKNKKKHDTNRSKYINQTSIYKGKHNIIINQSMVKCALKS